MLYGITSREARDGNAFSGAHESNSNAREHRYQVFRLFDIVLYDATIYEDRYQSINLHTKDLIGCEFKKKNDELVLCNYASSRRSNLFISLLHP
jgi:hypothetical protein